MYINAFYNYNDITDYKHICEYVTTTQTLNFKMNNNISKMITDLLDNTFSINDFKLKIHNADNNTIRKYSSTLYNRIVKSIDCSTHKTLYQEFSDVLKLLK